MLPTYIRCDLYLPGCVKTKVQTIVITGKKRSRNVSGKKFGLVPQLRWLTTVCLCGAVHCLLSTPCLQCTVKNEQKQLSISNQHIWVPRWHAFNFAQVPFQCVLGMPVTVVSKLNLKKKCVCIKYWFSKRKKKELFTSQIRTQMQVSRTTHRCGFRWNVARVFSNSSSSTHCRMQPDHCINSRWQTWSRTMMGLWCW